MDVLMPQLKSNLNKKCMRISERIFKCKDCNYQADKRYLLLSHMKSHGNGNPFLCGHCGYQSAWKNNLLRHLKRHTTEELSPTGNIDPQSFNCEPPFFYNKTLKDKKTFLCNICDYRTSKKYNLDRHMLSHSKEKPFVCGICDFRSARKYNIENHMNTHTGVKPFMCHSCDFRSAKKFNLDRHMNTHMKENPSTLCIKFNYVASVNDCLVSDGEKNLR